MKLLTGAILHAFRGISVDTYVAQADEFLHRQYNPELHLPYLETCYAPMLDLLHFLERNGFTNYIASGGDCDFMRPISSEVYGIPTERVIGSSDALRYESDGGDSRVVYRAQADARSSQPAMPTPTSRCSSSSGTPHARP